MWRSPAGVVQRKGLTDEKAARMLEAFRCGSTLRGFAVTKKRFKAYCDAHPAYASEALPLLEKNKRLADHRKGDRLRNLTHCKHGHLYSGANVHWLPNGRRQCRECQRRRNNMALPPSEDQIRRATAALNAGETILQICWGKVANKIVKPPIMSFRKLKLVRELDPVFNQFVNSVITRGFSSRAQQRCLAPDKFQFSIVRSQAADYHTIARLVPPHLPTDIRDDVVQSIFLALLEGTLQRDQVRARVGEFVRAHHREANKVGVSAVA